MTEAPEQQAERHLVIVGASAGGVEALISLVSTLPSDFPAPLVLAQHLDPNRPSQLGPILERHTTLPVVTVQEKASLEDGSIYVVPANYHMQISDHDVTLMVDSMPRPKPSINHVLSTAAEVYGERLIAVILTGMGSDGQAGAQEVKKRGGTVIIQDPATAAFPSMPRSLSPAVVDMSKPIEEIGPLLYQLLDHIAPAESLETEEENGRLLRDFLQQVRDVSGIDFSSYKRGTIQRRIQRRMVAVGVETLRAYITYVNQNNSEYQRLISSFLIKVTEFMRDQELFKTLERDVLPALVTRARESAGRELRIWSAGCATGEEAYSLAILLAEVLGDELNSLNVKIFATDLDANAIDFARRGLYPKAALASLPPRLIQRYFIEHEDGYAVSTLIRSLLVFGEHDLGHRPPFPRTDLVLCRNVLIYFTRDLQQRTLRLFAFSLRTGGYLVLGKSETVTPFSDGFQAEFPHLKIFRRQGERLLIPPPLDSDLAASVKEHQTEAQRQRRGFSGELLRMQDELQHTRNISDDLLLRLPIGVIVVDQRYDVQEINSAARRLLGIYHGAMGEDLIHLTTHLPPRLLRQAIDYTLKSGEQNVLEEVAMNQPNLDEPTFVQISCYPRDHDNEDSTRRRVLLLVQDVTRQVNDRNQIQSDREQQRQRTAQLQQDIDALEAENSSLRDTTTQLQQRIEALEREHAEGEQQRQQHQQQYQHVRKINEELVRANEELATANQQLRLMNDEFLMTSQEAQATTEEIETLSEETQATNEELETLNEELQGTIEELNTTVNDLTMRNGQMQLRLSDLEQRTVALETLVQNLPDAAAIIGGDGRALFANPAYDALWQEDGIMEDENGQHLDPDNTPQAHAARGEEFSLSYALRTRSGNRTWFEAQGYPLPEGNSTGGILIVRRRDSQNQ